MVPKESRVAATDIALPPTNGHHDDIPMGKLAAQVARRIEAEIIRRRWPVGESLGSEVDLRERHQVSRSVFREAVRLVEHHQVAWMRRGPNGGLFVCAPDAGPATRAIVIYLEYLGTSVTDLLHARVLLEPIAAALAVERMTEEGIAALRESLHAERRLPPGVRSNNRIHVMLGELSGNPVLMLFIDVLARLTTRYAMTVNRSSEALAARARIDPEQVHGSIVNSVIAGDGARAQIQLIDHLTEISQWMDEHRDPRRSASGNSTDPQLSDSPRTKLAEVLAARIHEEIADDGWQIGTVLGSEADLLARYGVSRAVVREAVRLLEYHAVARMRRGQGGGLVVSAPDPQASIDTIALYLDYERVTAQDLLVVRDAIEAGTVARVMRRHQDPDVVECLGAAARLATAGPPGPASKNDVFHTELAKLAGNPVLTLFLRIITDVFRRHVTPPQSSATRHETDEEVRRIHERILAAIVDGDEGVAKHRMRRHLAALSPFWH
jgi:DNA-binding FadR family transcriptional regulator